MLRSDKRHTAPPKNANAIKFQAHNIITLLLPRNVHIHDLSSSQTTNLRHHFPSRSKIYLKRSALSPQSSPTPTNRTLPQHLPTISTHLPTAGHLFSLPLPFSPRRPDASIFIACAETTIHVPALSRDPHLSAHLLDAFAIGVGAADQEPFSQARITQLAFAIWADEFVAFARVTSETFFGWRERNKRLSLRRVGVLLGEGLIFEFLNLAVKVDVGVVVSGVEGCVCEVQVAGRAEGRWYDALKAMECPRACVISMWAIAGSRVWTDRWPGGLAMSVLWVSCDVSVSTVRY